MPELPEVEQVRKTLLPHIKGKTITKVEVYLDRLVKHPSSEQFIKNLPVCRFRHLLWKKVSRL